MDQFDVFKREKREMFDKLCRFRAKKAEFYYGKNDRQIVGIIQGKRKKRMGCTEARTDH